MTKLQLSSSSTRERFVILMNWENSSQPLDIHNLEQSIIDWHGNW